MGRRQREEKEGEEGGAETGRGRDGEERDRDSKEEEEGAPRETQKWREMKSEQRGLRWTENLGWGRGGGWKDGRRNRTRKEANGERRVVGGQTGMQGSKERGRRG